MRYKELKNESSKDFKRYIGVKKEEFSQMVLVMKSGLNLGRKAALSCEDQVMMTLQYLREYRSMYHLSKDYSISESTVSRTLEKVENKLINSGHFSLPPKSELSALENKKVVLDATEQKIERPQHKQRRHYSGKNKQHTQKAQILADLETKSILSTDFSVGSQHDFALFKQKTLPLRSCIQILADSAYQGIAKIHANSQIPFKKYKAKPLTPIQKQHNRLLSKVRIVVEHIIRSLKIFKILALPYRNRRKRFTLRFNLIAALHNLNLSC